MKSKGWRAIVALLLASGACKTGSQAQQSPLSGRADEVVAEVDGKPVTYGEVEKEQGGKLLEDEAKAKGETLEQWFDKELLGMVAAPSDEEKQQFYEQNKSQMGGQTYEQIKDR